MIAATPRAAFRILFSFIASIMIELPFIGDSLSGLDRQQVDQRKDEHPDEIDEMPVEAADLDVLARRAPPQRDYRQVDHARQDVKHVQAGDPEEGRAEER